MTVSMEIIYSYQHTNCKVAILFDQTIVSICNVLNVTSKENSEEFNTNVVDY